MAFLGLKWEIHEVGLNCCDCGCYWYACGGGDGDKELSVIRNRGYSKASRWWYTVNRGLDFRRKSSPGEADLRINESFRMCSAYSWRMCVQRRGKFFIFDNLRSKSCIFGSSFCPPYSESDINAAISEIFDLDFNPRQPMQACCFRHQIQ